MSITGRASLETAARAASAPLLTRAFVLSVLASHCFFISYNMSIAEVPRALTDEAPWVIGLVVGALGVAGMLVRPLVGVWLDAGRRMRWVRIGAIGTAIAFLGYALDLGPWAMLPFRLLHGVAMACFTVALLSIVGNALPPARRGMGVGLYQTSGAVAQLYAAPLAVVLMVSLSTRAAFLVSGATVVLALLAATLAGDPHPPLPAPRVAWRDRAWISRSAFLPGLVFLCVTTPWGAVTAFLFEFADERGIANPGLFYTVTAVSQVASRVGVGWLADRLKPARAITPALVCGSIGLLVLSMAHDQRTMLIAGALYGLGLASTQTSIVALVVGRTAPATIGSAMATYTMAWDVGLVVGGVGFGFVVSATSPATTFAMLAALPIAGLALFLLRVAPEPRPPAASLGT